MIRYGKFMKILVKSYWENSGFLWTSMEAESSWSQCQAFKTFPGMSAEVDQAVAPPASRMQGWMGLALCHMECKYYTVIYKTHNTMYTYNMYVYMNTYMYMYMYMYMHVYVYVHVYVCICVYIYIYTYFNRVVYQIRWHWHAFHDDFWWAI